MRFALLIAMFVFAGCATRQGPFLLAVRGADGLYPTCAAVIDFATPPWQVWQSGQRFTACQNGRGAIVFLQPSQAPQTALGSVGETIGEATNISPIKPAIPVSPTP